VRILSTPYTIPSGQVVDVLIPSIIKDNEDKKKDSPKIVEPLVPTWDKIIIEVKEGRSLAKHDLNGRSDPYVKIECGEWKKKTKVRKENLNPLWSDAVYELNYKEAGDEDEIWFYVRDRDSLGKDDYIGEFHVSIKNIPPNKELFRWFRLLPHREIKMKNK